MAEPSQASYFARHSAADLNDSPVAIISQDLQGCYFSSLGAKITFWLAVLQFSRLKRRIREKQAVAQSFPVQQQKNNPATMHLRLLITGQLSTY